MIKYLDFNMEWGGGHLNMADMLTSKQCTSQPSQGDVRVEEKHTTHKFYYSPHFPARFTITFSQTQIRG